jgi:crotonobetaine/carnitine-CoA ligase
MTETNFTIGPLDGKQRRGYMGRAMPGFEARVVDEHDNEVTDGTPGELTLRATEPFAFATGYYGLPADTVSAWRNLWFHTGDRVIREPDGYYRFIDRIKDVIRRRGENISAWEVEQVLVAHSDVVSAAAIPVPSELGDDEVMAVVVSRRGFHDPIELLEHCRARLPYYAVPRYVEFAESLPLTANGKIQKSSLKDQGVSLHTWDREAAHASASSRNQDGKPTVADRGRPA